MVKSKPAGKQKIVCKDCHANIKDFYVAVKEKIEDLDFDFVEKNQEQEVKQYGGEVKIEFEGSKEIDEFTKKTMKVKIRFENIKRGKSDAKINVEFKVHYDYKNRWDTNSFKQFLFHLLLNYIWKDRLKYEYFIPVVIEYEKFVKSIKKELGMYDK